MKIKYILLTLAISAMSLLASASSVFACTTLGNQELCPNEFIK